MSSVDVRWGFSRRWLCVSSAPDMKSSSRGGARAWCTPGVRAGASGNSSLLCEFQGWTGLDKVCVSDVNARRRSMKREQETIECNLLIHVTDCSPHFY